jgi:hypothetical protein
MEQNCICTQFRLHRTVGIASGMGLFERVAFRPVLEILLAFPFGEDDVFIALSRRKKQELQKSRHVFHPVSALAKGPLQVGLIVRRDTQSVHGYVHDITSYSAFVLPLYTNPGSNKKPQMIYPLLRFICCSSMISINKMSCSGSFGSLVSKAATDAIAQRTDWKE